MTKKHVEPTKALRPLLPTALFAACGLAGMGHEVLWTRVARTLVGGDARGVAVAVTATLLGMVIGALVASRAEARWGALSAFIRIEVLAAITSALMPWLALPFGGLAMIAYGALGEGTAFACASFVIATLMFLPAALAMGAGLPLLVSALDPDVRAPARLYAAHAAGSAIGAWVIGFVLLEQFGAPITAVMLAATQLLVCVVLARRGRTISRVADRSATRLAPLFRSHAPVLIAALLAGASSFALQALWTRVAALALGPTVQAFALVAAVYVLALAIGAGAASMVVKRFSITRIGFVVSLFGAACTALVFTKLVGAWPIDTVDAFQHVADGRVSMLALARVIALPVAPVVIFFGAAFAFASSYFESTEPESRGPLVALLLASGAIGNIAGAVLAPFVLVPVFGLASAVRIAAAIPALAGVVAAIGFARRTSAWSVVLPPIGIALAATVLLFLNAPARFDAANMTRGPFLYASTSAPDLGEVIFAHDGVDSTVTVRSSHGERMLQIDGKIDGSSIGDAPTQTLVGLLPTLVAHHPERALVIGLGTGMTVDAVRAVPGHRSIDVAELVRGVRYAAPYFAGATHDVLRQRDVHVRETDGSLLLRYGDESWDVIVSEPSNPWVAGMGDLFSEETFRAARAHLREGGVMATWFHVYATDLEIVREIMATFASVFPNATLWELSRGEDYMLLGVKGEEGLDLDRIATRAASPDVERALHASGIPDAPSLVGRIVASSEGILRGTANVSPLSLRTGNLEARAARALYRDASQGALELFGEIAITPAELRLRAHGQAGHALALAAPAAVEARALARQVVLRALSHDENGAIFLGERAVGLAPTDPTIQDLVATLYLARGKTHALAQEFADARDALMTVLELDPPNADTRVDALVTLGDIDVAMGRAQSGLDRFQRARRVRPSSPDIADRIASALDRLGATEDAARERALAEQLRNGSIH